jgi:hypothetical protein
MLNIYKEKAGVISKDPVWICIDSKGYLYTGFTLFRLMMEIMFEWRDDRHIASILRPLKGC